MSFCLSERFSKEKERETKIRKIPVRERGFLGFLCMCLLVGEEGGGGGCSIYRGGEMSTSHPATQSILRLGMRCQHHPKCLDAYKISLFVFLFF